MRLFLHFLFVITVTNANKKDIKSEAISKAHFEFSLDLYKTLVLENNRTNNLAVSPYSINLVLSMLFLGTIDVSNTSRQLRSIMHLKGASYVDIHNGFKNIVSNFDQNYYRTKMKIAHGFYINSDVTVTPVYDKALREFYHSNIDHMNFKDTVSSKELINEFIEESTDGKIDEMLEQMPDPDSKLVVVDAMTLDTKWLYSFDERKTFDKGMFFLPSQERLEVPTMAGKFELPIGYSQELECRVLELPFSKKRISMFLLLPDDAIDGLNRLEANISTENIQHLLGTLKDDIVNVKLPKFNIKSHLDLAKPLKQLGLTDILNKDTPDLGLMAPTDDIKISSLHHRSMFDISESGSKPPNSEEIGSGSTFGQKSFEVDHSFLFLVWDYYSGMLLLMGRVINPLED